MSEKTSHHKLINQNDKVYKNCFSKKEKGKEKNKLKLKKIRKEFRRSKAKDFVICRK